MPKSTGPRHYLPVETLAAMRAVGFATDPAGIRREIADPAWPFCRGKAFMFSIGGTRGHRAKHYLKTSPRGVREAAERAAKAAADKRYRAKLKAKRAVS